MTLREAAKLAYSRRCTQFGAPAPDVTAKHFARRAAVHRRMRKASHPPHDARNARRDERSGGDSNVAVERWL
jgi:hypothetical protein